MKKLFILSFAAVTIAAACKKNTPTPPPQKTDLEFNNTLAEPVTIDIYEHNGSGYDEGFLWNKKFSVQVPANTQIKLPTLQLTHGREYVYDWYNADSTITGWHQYNDSAIVKGVTKYNADSCYYRLSFIYDSVSNATYTLQGKPAKYRNILARHTGVHLTAVDAYSGSTGQSVWGTLSAQQQAMSFSLNFGYAGYCSVGWLFYTLSPGGFKVTAYTDIVNKKLFGEITDSVSAIGLSGSSNDTLFFTPANSSMIYKMHVAQ